LRGNSKNNGNGKSKGEIRGSLHSAAHDETVSSFGRDDVCFGRVEQDGKDKCNDNGSTQGDGRNNGKNVQGPKYGGLGFGGVHWRW
jgi:hypothetical protein